MGRSGMIIIEYLEIRNNDLDTAAFQWFTRDELLLYSMNIWRVLYLANLSFWKFHGYLI